MKEQARQVAANHRAIALTAGGFAVEITTGMRLEISGVLEESRSLEAVETAADHVKCMEQRAAVDAMTRELNHEIRRVYSEMQEAVRKALAPAQRKLDELQSEADRLTDLSNNWHWNNRMPALPAWINGRKEPRMAMVAERGAF